MAENSINVVNVHGLLNGLTTQNSGRIIEVNMADPFVKGQNMRLEVLEHKRHNPDYDILAYYFFDKNLNNGHGAKVEVTIYRNIHNGTYGSEVYYFKDSRVSQHYFSRNYLNFVKMPKKYYDIVKYIHPVFLFCFGK